jgi:hypothetical protein
MPFRFDPILKLLILLPFFVSTALAQGQPAAKEQLTAALLKVPLTFEKNVGQADPRYAYITSAPASDVLFAGPEIRLPVGQGKTSGFVLDGVAKNIKGTLQNPTGGVSNYYRDSDQKHWHAGIPHFRRLVYSSVYPGVDAAFYGQDGRLEYDFIVQPGADPRAIALRHPDAEKLSIDSNGDLIVQVRGGGEIRQERPFAYQMNHSTRVPVEVAFDLREDGRVTFRLGEYDRHLPLTIDPVIAYLTYVTNGLSGATMVLDRLGFLYVSANKLGSLLVLKLNRADGSVFYSTLVGSGVFGLTPVPAISVDGQGRAFVAGGTSSANFPVIFPFQFTTAAGASYSGAKLSGSTDAFIARLNSSGQLDRSSYLGGSDTTGPGATEYIDQISAASDGTLYFVGCNGSASFPYKTAPPNPNTYD